MFEIIQAAYNGASATLTDWFDQLVQFLAFCQCDLFSVVVITYTKI